MRLYNIKDIITKKHHLAAILSRIMISLPQPIFILIYITLKCNSKCVWCFQKKDLFYKRDLLEMNLKDFRTILSSLKKAFLFKPHVHLIGGEPLSHPEFPEFLNVSKEFGFYLSVTTNIDYLGNNINIINNSSIKQLNISLNKRPLKTVQDDYAELVSQIDCLRNKGKKVINLNYFLNPSEYHLLESIVLFLNKKLKKGMVETVVCQHFLFENKEDMVNEVKRIDLGTMVKQIKLLKSASLNFKMLFFPNINTEDLRQYYFSNFSFRNECYVPWLGLSVYPELIVTLGGGMLWCNNIAGDLNSQSWRDIWHGEKINNFRRAILKNGLPKECNRCCHKLYY